MSTQRPPLHLIQRKTQTQALVWNLIESVTNRTFM